jgi:hypothetical protein
MLFTPDGPLDPNLLYKQFVADLILSADDKLPDFVSDAMNK